MREIEPRILTSEPEGLAIVRERGIFGALERAKPQACSVPREADLRHPFAPVALPYATVKFRGCCRIRIKHCIFSLMGSKRDHFCVVVLL